MTDKMKVSRRDFIKIVSAAGGGLVLGAYLPAKGYPFDEDEGKAARFEPSVWLRISDDGTTTITVSRSEMGQGVRTALPMLIAEELEIDWSAVQVVPALADEKYGNMSTGGSRSIRTFYDTMRKVGATAREMLIAAAAQEWHVEPATCRAEKGVVIHKTSDRRLAYGNLVAAAAKLPVPEDAPLNKRSEFTLLNKSIPRVDTEAKVTGKAVFGIDVKRPDTLIAAVARSPVFRAKVKSFDGTKARAVAGVRDVLEIPDAVAVLANSTWAAFKGREALSVTWDEGAHADLDSDGIRALFHEKGKADGVAVRQDGDAKAAIETAAQKIEAAYDLPYLSHAPLEPMNCVADVRADRAEIWAPTQTPRWAQGAVAEAIGLPLEKVKLHTTLLGGGFGRRLMPDFAVEAAHVSKAAGAPVKVVWTREQDMQHDFYRPASYHQLVAGADEQGNLIAWQHKVTCQSITGQHFPDNFDEKDPDMLGGAKDVSYQIPNISINATPVEVNVPVGWWRSVYHSQNAFANECFMDEVAAALKTDPVELRRQLLPADSRLRKVLERAAKEAGWGSSMEKGKGRGIACHACFGSFVAQVAEVSVAANGRVTVDKVVCAVDCGPVVNPRILETQVEGGVVFALSAVMTGEITIGNGRVQQTNFDDYTVITFEEMPEVEVHILDSTDSVGGIGEPGVPPLAPAVCNAIFAATGKRIKRLPIGGRV